DIDVLPCALTLAPHAQRPPIAKADLDRAIAADQAVDRAPGARRVRPREQHALHAVAVLEVAQPLALDWDAKDLLAATQLNLSDPPLGRRLVVVEEQHVEPVRAPVEQVWTGRLHALQPTDRARSQQLPGPLEYLAEAPLVIKRQLRAARLAHF